MCNRDVFTECYTADKTILMEHIIFTRVTAIGQLHENLIVRTMIV